MFDAKLIDTAAWTSAGARKTQDELGAQPIWRGRYFMIGSGQAGAIPVKAEDRSLKFLLVTAKQDPSAWIFPKGHIEVSESAETAAIRELREEAGIEGEPLGHIGTLEFDSGYEHVRVEYFLLRFVSEVGSGEGRRRKWCNFEDALETLTFADAKRLLGDARPVIERRMQI